MLRPQPRNDSGRASLGALGRRRASSGFTLVEVAVAVAFTAIIFSAGIGLLGTVITSTAENSTELRALDRSVDAIRELRNDLGRARVLSVAADGSAISYSLPMMTADGAPELDAAGEIVWGCRDRAGQRVGGVNTIRFVPKRTLDESSLEQDLNGDGDFDDAFEVGHLVRVSDTGERVAIRQMQVWVVLGDRAGDVDGDGTPDPVFQVSPGGQVLCRVSRPTGERGVQTTVVRVTVADSSAVR